MVCSYCGHDTQVINSRHQKRLNQVWRRRKCRHCQAIFTSIESYDTEKSLRVQRQGALQPFSREQLLISLYDSLRHRVTAVADAAALCATITSLLTQNSDNALIERNQVVETTLAVLERFDTVAATHYRAFHQLS